MQGIVVTASEEFLPTAMEEVKRDFPHLSQEVLGPAVFWLHTGDDLDGVQNRLLAESPIFVRHIHGAKAWLVNDEQELFASVIQRLEGDLGKVPAGASVAVQARAINTRLQWQGRELKAACDQVLRERGYRPVIKDPQWIISVTQAKKQVYYGLDVAERNLCDWTGGMIHFRKEADDISRAKFKLLEAIVRFGLDLPVGGRALDLGAAPGGWTQELLSRGLQVLAVDTGELDPRLKGATGLKFLRANVKNLNLSPQDQFDLITCDMSWDPIFTAKLLNGLIGNLRNGGQVIMTIKLMGKKPLPTIERVLNMLDDSLKVCHAQHLWHNRQEITLHLQKR